MAMPYQNNMYPQMQYGQQPQYGVNSYLSYMPQRFQQPEPMQTVQQVQAPQQQVRGLNGMVVQSVDNVTADCVPMDGSAAFFPKQDLSEIYVKSWNADGTIRTLTYKPIEMSESNRKIDSEANESVTDVFQKRFDELLGKIEQLEQMITSSMTNPMTNPLTKKSASSTKKAGDMA